jgi:hypothetical protein
MTFTGASCPSSCTSSGTSCSCSSTSSLSLDTVVQGLFAKPGSTSPVSAKSGVMLNIAHNALFWAVFVMLLWVIVHYNRAFLRRALFEFRDITRKTYHDAYITSFKVILKRILNV